MNNFSALSSARAGLDVSNFKDSLSAHSSFDLDFDVLDDSSCHLGTTEPCEPPRSRLDSTRLCDFSIELPKSSPSPDRLSSSHWQAKPAARLLSDASVSDDSVSSTQTDQNNTNTMDEALDFSVDFDFDMPTEPALSESSPNEWPVDQTTSDVKPAAIDPHRASQSTPELKNQTNIGILGPVSSQSSALARSLRARSIHQKESVPFLFGHLNLENIELFEQDTFANLLNSAKWPFLPVAEVVSVDFKKQQTYTHYYSAKHCLEWINDHSETDPNTRLEINRINFYLLFKDFNEPIYMGAKLLGALHAHEGFQTETDILLWHLQHAFERGDAPDTLDTFSLMATLGILLGKGSEALLPLKVHCSGPANFSSPSFLDTKLSDANIQPALAHKLLSNTAPNIEPDFGKWAMISQSLLDKIEDYISEHFPEFSQPNELNNPYLFEQKKSSLYNFCLSKAATYIAEFFFNDPTQESNPHMIQLKSIEILSDLPLSNLKINKN